MSASIMMTPSRFGSSHSGSQAYAAAAPTSMADTLPSIDFNFNDLRERMAQFTARFDEFIERGRKRVLEERNAFRMNLAELEDQQRQRKQTITELGSKSSTHAQIVAREAQETEEMHEAIQSLTAQKEEHISRKDHLKTEIATIQSAIKHRKDAQAAHQRSLDAQARYNSPELRFWENCLGMRMEGTGVDDSIKFIFVCIDDRDADRDCWFELHIGGREYQVTSTKPRLNRDDVDEVQERLNETKELGTFLKSIRTLFAQAIRP